MKYQYLNTDQMMTFERYAFENYPITLAQMMQNAGKAVFDVVMNEILPRITSQTEGGQSFVRVLVVSGKGNNGGDALITARLLAEQGIDVTVFSPHRVNAVVDANLHPLQKNALKHGVVEFSDTLSGEYDLIIDALFGFSLKGNPRLPEAKIIEQINCTTTPILAVDVPSGLDIHNGSIGKPCIKADYTIALGMLKKGFEEHLDSIGKVYLGDLGIPKEAYADMGYKVPEFKDKRYTEIV